MPRWKDKMEFKKYLTDDLSDFEVKFVAQALLSQLKDIHREEDVTHELEEIVSNLEWIIESIDDKEDIEEHCFDTWSEALRSELTMIAKLDEKRVKRMSNKQVLKINKEAMKEISQLTKNDPQFKDMDREAQKKIMKMFSVDGKKK